MPLSVFVQALRCNSTNKERNESLYYWALASAAFANIFVSASSITLLKSLLTLLSINLPQRHIQRLSRIAFNVWLNANLVQSFSIVSVVVQHRNRQC